MSTINTHTAEALRDLYDLDGHTTVNLYDTYHVQRGGAITATWAISARGKTQ